MAITLPSTLRRRSTISFGAGRGCRGPRHQAKHMLRPVPDKLSAGGNLRNRCDSPRMAIHGAYRPARQIWVKMRKSRIEHIGSVVPPRAAEPGTVLITLGDCW